MGKHKHTQIHRVTWMTPRENTPKWEWDSAPRTSKTSRTYHARQSRARVSSFVLLIFLQFYGEFLVWKFRKYISIPSFRCKFPLKLSFSLSLDCSTLTFNPLTQSRITKKKYTTIVTIKCALLHTPIQGRNDLEEKKKKKTIFHVKAVSVVLCAKHSMWNPEKLFP